MNYEEFLERLNSMQKELDTAVKNATKHSKAIAKNAEAGNLTELRKSLQQIAEASTKMQEQIASLTEEADAFDTHAYVISGDFTRQLLEACDAIGVNVKGEKGIYEMFPYKVRIVGDEEHAEEVWINRKKQSSIRPRAIANTIRADQEKLNRVAFNPEPFMNELSEAYELTCLRSGARIGSNQTLTKVYKTLVPMARARKEYDLQAFAYDLARLYECGAEAWVTKGGKQYLFGPSRDGKTGIRVLSRAGVESYINTIQFINTEGEGV